MLGPPIRQGDLNGRGRGKQDRYNGYPMPGITGPIRDNRAWPNNRGYERSTEVHLRNAERKALKEQARLQGRYFDDRYDRVVRVYQPRRDDRRDNILRSVVYSVIANNYPGSYSSCSAEPRYRYDTYGYPAYNGYNYNGYPAYSGYDYNGYSPSYYGGYPANGGYSTTTYYDFYDPYGSYYDPYDYSYSSYDQGYPGYSSYGSGLPFLSGSGTGGFLGRLLTELIAYGYNQGYGEALRARSAGYQTRYFSDPYDPYVYVDESQGFQDIGYDPYSCVGENRRYLSEGYELGYRDALNGQTDYDPYYDNGNVDLVSALISTALSIS